MNHSLDDAAGRPLEDRIRFTLLVLVVVLTASAWLLTYFQVQNMGTLMRMGVPMSLGMEGWADALSFVVFSGMWLVMMLAMMLPSTYPTLLLHRTIFEKRHPERRGGTFLFGLGYFLTWTATGVLFYSGYVLVGEYRDGVPNTMVLRASGLALVLAGLYQWSWLKQACLRHCQSPLHFIIEHWHQGRWGALRMGTTHGLYCFGCCWGLMTILFVMGIMHLGWMAAIGAIILLEKIVPSGKWIPHGIGAVFVIMGIVVIVSPDILRRVSSHIALP